MALVDDLAKHDSSSFTGLGRFRTLSTDVLSTLLKCLSIPASTRAPANPAIIISSTTQEPYVLRMVVRTSSDGAIV